MSRRLSEFDPRRPPLRWVLRLPVHLYRARLGWLLGERFLELTTRGRRTGAHRAVVLEVLGRDAASGAFVIASAWGRGAQWLRNVDASPAAEVRISRRRFSANVERLREEAAVQRLRSYAGHHRWAYRFFIGPLLLGRPPRGSADEFEELARRVPILLVHPVRARASQAGEAGW